MTDTWHSPLARSEYERVCRAVARHDLPLEGAILRLCQLEELEQLHAPLAALEALSDARVEA